MNKRPRSPAVVPGRRDRRDVRGPDDEPAYSEPRVVRVFMVVGVLVAVLYMLLFAAVPEVAAHGSAQAAVAACGVLACLFAAAALRPRAIGLKRAMQMAVMACGIGAGAVAVLSGQGLSLIALGFLPLLLCAAATLISPGVTLAIAFVHGAFLLLLTAAELHGVVGPARAPADVLSLLAGHGGLLLAGVTIGLLMRRYTGT